MDMFASVLHLDRKAAKALRITDAYSLHRVVYSLYEDVRDSNEKAASVPSGILYVDQGGDQTGRKVLMLANRRPAASVDGRYGGVQVKEIPGRFLEYNHYRFKVVVNPTRRDSASRRLMPVKGRDAIAQWFAERAQASWGFSVPSEHLQVEGIEVEQFNDKEQRKVTISKAQIQGLLNVNNSERFRQSFTQGIGRSRTYGCGLLQIVPLIDNPGN